VSEPATKRCARCRVIKPAAEFRRRRDGGLGWCLPCDRAYNRDRMRAQRGTVPRPAAGPGEKYCPRCRRLQPRAAFAPAGARPSGLRVYCRPCERAVHRGYAAARRAARGGEGPSV
jgi:hypothetical protein